MPLFLSFPCVEIKDYLLTLCSVFCLVLEPLKKEVGLDLPLLGTMPCGLCRGSFQGLSPMFSPPGNVVLNLCSEENWDWPMEIEPKPSYYYKT